MVFRAVNCTFDDYSISSKITEILLHWGYELVEDDIKWFIFFVHIKMSYYQFNRQELLQKTKDRYSNCGRNEKAAECYIANKDV